MIPLLEARATPPAAETPQDRLEADVVVRELRQRVEVQRATPGRRGQASAAASDLAGAQRRRQVRGVRRTAAGSEGHLSGGEVRMGGIIRGERCEGRTRVTFGRRTPAVGPGGRAALPDRPGVGLPRLRTGGSARWRSCWLWPTRQRPWRTTSGSQGRFFMGLRATVVVGLRWTAVLPGDGSRHPGRMRRSWRSRCCSCWSQPSASAC